MSVQIHQINFRYSAEQDRLTLSCNTTAATGYAFWLTRRYVKLLWRGLRQSMEKVPGFADHLEPAAKRAVVAFEGRNSVEASDFSKDFEADDLVYPAGAEPRLATGLRISEIEGGTTRITIKCVDGDSIDFNLNQKVLFSFCHLLVSCSRKTGWDLALRLLEDEGAAPAGKVQVH